MNNTVASQVSKYMGNAVSVSNIWGGIVINVKASPYLAKGDGVTDDTVAIQAAINYAISTGKKEITFPAGTYKYGVLTNTNGITFIGDGVTLYGTTPITITSLAALKDESVTGIVNVVTGFGASSSAQTTTGSIASGSNQLSVASVIDFKQNQGIFVDGNKEIASLTITAGATASGNVTVTLDGVAFTVAVVAGDTAIQVADKIRATTYLRWTTGGTIGTATVTFTANQSGVKTDATYSAGTTNAAGTMTITAQGTDGLVTTISAISGTTITLSVNATVTVNNVAVMHDATKAFEDAIAACGPRGVLFIPKPDAYYRIGRKLVLANPIRIQGASYFEGSGVNDPTIVFSPAVKTGFEVTSIGDVSIERLYWKLESVASDTVAGINLNTTPYTSIANIQLRDVYIYMSHIYGVGVKGRGIITSKFLNVRTFQGTHGFYFDNNGTSLNFDTCWPMSCTVTGFYIASHEYCSFINCACDSPNKPNYGYHINSCNGFSFNGCGAESMGKSMFRIQAGNGVSINGCRAVGANQLGTAAATFAELTDEAAGVVFSGCMEDNIGNVTPNIKVTGSTYPIIVNSPALRGVTINSFVYFDVASNVRGSLKLGGLMFVISPFNGELSVIKNHDVSVLEKRLGVLKSDYTGFLGYIENDGTLVARNFTALPTADVTQRGKIARVEGGAGVSDHIYVCIKDATNAYVWKQMDN